MVAISAVLGVLSFGSLLCSRHIAEGDLWAKLALGAHVWKYGALPHHDVFAFTPVLPQYVDHEFGAGTIFFGLLKFFGPASLMWLKISLAFTALGAALLTARRGGCDWAPLLVLAIPAAACVVLGYVPVIRSHAFTYCLFALTLFCLEEITRRRPVSSPRHILPGEERASSHSSVILPAIVMVVLMLIWVNVHGGFVAGLGTIGIYAGLALMQSFWARIEPSEHYSKRIQVLVVAAFGSLAVTCINPYGPKFWFYILPAVLAKRPFIAEWQPLPVFAWDVFMPFRILFLLVLGLVVAGWKGTSKSWTGLVMLVVTAFLAWRSRRHAPFFGIAALAFAGPYLASTLTRLSTAITRHSQLGPLKEMPADENCHPSSILHPPSSNPLPGALPCLLLYVALAVYAALRWLPDASFQVLAPVGHDPVREADILSLAQAKGNLATPFHWGSYSSWRLYPNVKVSMDGRYEAAYPESTFQLNGRFFDKNGPDWDRLIRDYRVDFVILDLTQGGLRPEDLLPRGYTLVWFTKGCSALMALEKYAAHLRQVAEALPPATIEPLDPAIPDRWWGTSAASPLGTP